MLRLRRAQVPEPLTDENLRPLPIEAHDLRPGDDREIGHLVQGSKEDREIILDDPVSSPVASRGLSDG